jgi:hypothetical protein
VSAYRDLAHRLLREAAETENPAKAERLKKREQEYLLLADVIEAPEPPITEQKSPAVQPQPQDDDEEEAVSSPSLGA